MPRFRYILANAVRAFDQYGRPYLSAIGPRDFDPEGYLTRNQVRTDDHGRYVFARKSDFEHALNNLREAGYIV